ncbi:RlpA-like double-psi beta-barrel domain-containing protein [Lentibacillus jeotgali]|uniref:RlpA-like double-psi beta-barrel domain-containing protein n=1 Tax=Lentibacillus jeotgali TaxID=558169 RepID=UPI00026287FE|nr:RlpA-like double-psi beta-barrel domain-containing protein [Lentibacillus jeotgali]
MYSKTNPYFTNLYPYAYHPYDAAQQLHYQDVMYPDFRQQFVSGQATWTEGGGLTKCGIPWSDNLYMTAAVGENSPYQCGQTLHISYPVTGRSILVEIVDQVPGYPDNRLNVHRRVFETLGANPQQGVIDIQIAPVSQVEQQQWGRYLLEITQTAYSGYNITEYNFVNKTQESPSRTRETYEYSLQSVQETITVRASVVYNPGNNRVISLDIKEV